MSKHCWYDVNIDIENCFHPDFIWPDITDLQTDNKAWEKYRIWSLPSEGQFKPEWLEYMDSIGFPIEDSMIFYRQSFGHTTSGPIDDKGTEFNVSHVDLCSDTSIFHYGINWCYGGKDSQMIWYELPPENDRMVRHTPAGTAFLAWPSFMLKEVERVHIDGRPKLVSTGLPHEILMQDEPRWCFSLRSSALNRIHDWDSVVELLRSKNLLIERDPT